MFVHGGGVCSAFLDIERGLSERSIEAYCIDLRVFAGILRETCVDVFNYPIKSEGEKPAFSAALIYSTEGDKELVFIGLNTAFLINRFLLLPMSYIIFTRGC
jgi:hypothetical protein